MSIIKFRNDSVATIYLNSFGHQQILVGEIIEVVDDETKLKDDTQIITLINAGDLVLIDDLGADRTAADAIQILEGIRDKVVAGGLDGQFLCTNATSDLVWAPGAVVVKDEGIVIGANNCTAINFIGLSITATDAGAGQVDVTIVALQNIVEDTTPQLGGNLDVNGNSIVTTANGDIVLTPNGTGIINIGGVLFSKKVSVALLDNQTAPSTIFSYSKTTESAWIDYQVIRNTARTTGTLYISTDGTTVAHSDTNIESGSPGPGIVLSAVVNGSNIDVRYTSTSTGFAPTYNYQIRMM